MCSVVTACPQPWLWSVGLEWMLPEGQAWGFVILFALCPAPPRLEAHSELCGARVEEDASSPSDSSHFPGRQFLTKFSQRVAQPLLFS